MSAPNDQAPASGQESFGPYLVYERLGVGGMATVHRAKERGIEGFERIVALKRLLPHLAEDASFVKSFVREAKLASMLQHANIVQLYELGRVGTVYFISMEYIDGRDVRRILRQARKVTGPATINVTLSLLIQLCDALDYAHTRHDEDGNPLSIVHRDVSPSNLLVTRSGHLKVIDFGIAKAQSSQLRTATGRVKGKLAYMAPEAISGKELDSRSDIFSAGVIAHELLTARPLFASKNEYQTLIKVQRGDVLAPSTFNQACPPELDAIVLKALARDPDQRYMSAAQMRDELHGVRIKYNLSATNREVQSWCEWAFSLEAPGNNFSGPMVTDSLAGVSQSRSPILPPGVPLSAHVQARDTARTSVPLPLRAPAQTDEGTGPTMTAHQTHAHDEHDADVAWGGVHEGEGEEQQPVLLDDVPDVSSKFPAVPAGLGAAAQMAMGADIASRKTLMGQAMPQSSSRRSSQPNMWAQGSSEDAIATRGGGRFPTGAEFTPAQGALGIGDDTTRTPLVEGQSYGAGVAAGKKGNLRVGIIAGAVVAVAAAVVAVVMMSKSTKEAPPVVAKPQTGKVKFVVEPPDSTVVMAGFPDHVGSPYSLDLDPGQVQVKIQHNGFRTYMTTVDLSAGETQTLRVVLEQGGKSNTAGFSLDSTPTGLVAILDDSELAQRTPITNMEIQPGRHVVTLKQNGVEVWRQEFMASADQTIEYKPVLTEEKKRERAEQQQQKTVAANPAPDRPAKTQRDIPNPTRVVKEETDVGGSRDREPMVGSAANTTAVLPSPPETHGTAPADDHKTAPVDDHKTEGTADKGPPVAPDHKDASGTVAGTGPGSAKTAPTGPTGPATPKAGSPAIVSPGAVRRVSGSLPSITTVPRAGETPPGKISTMLCIDNSGNVTTVKLLTKGLPGTVSSDLQTAMSQWKYTPYKQAGAAQPACFVVSFAVKWPDSSSRGN